MRVTRRDRPPRLSRIGPRRRDHKPHSSRDGRCATRVASRRGRKAGMLDRVATEALRSGSPERLEASIRDLLTDAEHAELRAAAEGASPAMADLAREFGRRTDVTADSFAFMVEDTAEG